MESSMNSMNKALSSKAQTEDDSPKESSWTFYIDQDFLCDNHEQSSFSSGYESPSLMTDAASSAARKAKDNKEAGGFTCDKSKRNISTFRKRKVKGAASMDADLEDTASSPVNSPKVSYMNEYFQLKQKEKATIDISEEKRNTSGHNGLAVVGGDSDITQLKKKGLCLVPMSTMANYFR